MRVLLLCCFVFASFLCNVSRGANDYIQEVAKLGYQSVSIESTFIQNTLANGVPSTLVDVAVVAVASSSLPSLTLGPKADNIIRVMTS